MLSSVTRQPRCTAISHLKSSRKYPSRQFSLLCVSSCSQACDFCHVNVGSRSLSWTLRVQADVHNSLLISLVVIDALQTLERTTRILTISIVLQNIYSTSASTSA
jgi:hypothetical protein